MTTYPWLFFTLLIPLTGWLLLICFRTAWFRRIALWFSFVSSIASTLLFVLFFVQGGAPWIDPWIPVVGIDVQNVVLLPFVSLIGSCLVVMSPKSVMDRGALADVLLTVAITQVFFCSQNMWLLSWAWLLGGWPVYTTWFKGKQSHSHTHNSTLFLLSSVAFLGVTMVLLYGFDISLSLTPNMVKTLPESIKMWFLPVCLFAVAVRIGLFPFHTWILSCLHEGTPASLLMVLCPASGIYILLRLRLMFTPPEFYTVMAFFGVCSAGYFLLVSLGQKNQFPAVVYLVLSQIGLIFMGLVSREQQSVTGALVLWLAVGISGCGLLLLSWQLRVRRGDIPLHQFHGLIRQCPFLATLFFLLGMGLIGLPGTLTFVAEDLIVQGILIHHSSLSILYILITALSAVTFLRLYSRIFLGKAESSIRCADLTAAQTMMGFLLVLALFLPGFFPRPVVTIPGDFIQLPYGSAH